MPFKARTADNLRAVFSSLERLSQASLGPLRFRWDELSLCYDPVAGLAEGLSDDNQRLLESIIERFLEPVRQPDAPKPQPLQTRPIPFSDALHPNHPADQEIVSIPPKIGLAASESKGRFQGRLHAGISGQMPSALSGSGVSKTDTANAIAQILDRHVSHIESAGGSIRTIDSGAPHKEPPIRTSSDGTPVRGNSAPSSSVDFGAAAHHRRLSLMPAPNPPDALKAGRPTHVVAHVDPANAEAWKAGKSASGSGSGPRRSVEATKGGRSASPMTVGSQGDIHSILGKSVLSRSGLSVPIKSEPAVSADRLLSWAAGATHGDTSRTRKPAKAGSTAIDRDSADQIMEKPVAASPSLSSRLSGSEGRGAHLSSLERLVSQYNDPDDRPSRSSSGPESLRSVVNRSRLFNGTESTESSKATVVSDTDFARRLENVLLRESRRHGILVEDQ